MDDCEALIIGAGPTGLVLALWLGRLGIKLRIVDKTAGPGTTSRAIVVHARTLEFYRQLGIVQRVVDGGTRFSAVNLWINGRRTARVPFEDLGRGVTNFPFVIIFPQDQQEAMLVDELAKIGIAVERQTELVSFEASDQGVSAKLKTANGEVRECQARYLAGCDGAHSRVREQLGVEFQGAAYNDVFFVADIVADGPATDGQTHLALDDADFLAMFPMKGPGCVRLVGAVRTANTTTAELRWEDVSKRVIDRLDFKIREVRWFSTYRVYHRVAAEFRRGPVFLLGDAAHIHSPVGGQGMNTGIGDAVNLAWKMAAVLRQRIDSSALDSYEPERIAFARRLVSTTDRAFEFINQRGPIAKRVRLTLVPFLFPKLFGFSAVRRFLFRTVSQTAINYRHSTLSEGKAGAVVAGDRLPWIELDRRFDHVADNYASLDSLDWQVHCYGEASAEVIDLCAARALKLRNFAWQPSMAEAGLKRDAIYLIRPDGHVALAQPVGDRAALRRYLDRYGIRAAGAR